MQIPKVSIIVPNYNSAETIELCVNSILAQSETDWELILADNGSTDNSREVIEKMEAVDNRIRSIMVPERGVSAARNAGIDAACGHYITFIDSDDSVEPGFLKQLMSCDADLTVCSYQVDYIDTFGQVSRSKPASLNTFNWKIEQCKDTLNPAFENGFMHFCWNKIFRRDIIQAHKIRYKPYPVNEDFIFVLEYLNHVKSISLINKPLYHWRRPANKVTGVNSLPDNLLEIYNHSHLLTRRFFKNDTIADRIAYFSYELLVYKYYEAMEENRISKSELKCRLTEFAANHLVKTSYKAYKPESRGEKVFHWLINRKLFNVHYFLSRKILKQ